MNKNYLLWLLFFILLSITSATACIAAGQDFDSSQKNNQESSVTSKEDVTEIGGETTKTPATDEKKDKEVKQTTPSILNSNFIFYIIYKFKFVESKSIHSKDDDNDDDIEMPLLSYTRSLYTAIHALFEKRY